jgi:hypothetical protein
MKVLCCLDGTNIEQISKAVKSMLSADQLTLSLIYVTDSSPHGDLERQRPRDAQRVRLSVIDTADGVGSSKRLRLKRREEKTNQEMKKKQRDYNRAEKEAVYFS